MATRLWLIPLTGRQCRALETTFLHHHSDSLFLFPLGHPGRLYRRCGYGCINDPGLRQQVVSSPRAGSNRRDSMIAISAQPCVAWWIFTPIAAAD